MLWVNKTENKGYIRVLLYQKRYNESTYFSPFVHLCIYFPLPSFLIYTDGDLGFFQNSTHSDITQ